MTINDSFGPLRKGMLEFLVLKIASGRSAYAADILASLEKTPFATQEGTLYPLLSRLRRDGLVEYEWVESAAGPPRKYYRLTETGRAYLKEFDEHWETINQTVATIAQPV